MIDRNPLFGSVEPFARRWHVIQEIDLAPLIARHSAVRALCDRLEDCADALPVLPSDDQRTELCADLRDLVERGGQDGDDPIDAMLMRRPGNPLTDALLDHVRYRRAADAAHAADLIEALSSTTANTVAADTLGYMLRCCFDGCRRAMDFAELTILTLASHRLTPEARDILVSGLCRRALH